VKKIISFSLWGDKQYYISSALRNVKLSKSFYPDWVCRFYVDEHFNKKYIDELKDLGAEVIKKTIKHRYEPYTWRFLAAMDADIMISRDCDTFPTEREKIAVDEWLASDKDFHIIRDSKYHTHKIMAGMWGVRNNLLDNIGDLLDNWNHLNMIHNDQLFLSLIIYPKIIHTAFIHDEFCIFKDENSVKIKYKRDNLEYIGAKRENPFDYFENIYCINLDRRPDRWLQVQEEFKITHILNRVKRFSAIINLDGRVGLVQTHLKLLKLAKEQNMRNILIFEDDVKFINMPLESLGKAINQLENIDWSMFYLGANVQGKLESISLNLAILKKGLCAHAIAYNNNMYDLLINKFSKVKKIITADDILDVHLLLMQQKHLSLIINPMIVTQQASYSDLEKKQVDYSYLEENFKKNID